MDLKKLFLSILPGFLPIVVFVAIESFFGTSLALLSALLFSVGELIFIYIKERKIEKLVLIDVLMILLLGGVSYISENDIFFKLKPVFFELIFIVFFAVSIYTPLELMQKMMQRQMKRAEIAMDFKNKKFMDLLKIFMFLMIIHVVITIFAAFFLSSAVWGFVAGPLLYIMIFGYMGIEFLKKLKNRV